MSNKYFRQITNKSLHDCNYELIEDYHDPIIKEKEKEIDRNEKEIEINEDVDNEEKRIELNTVISEDEFLSAFVKTFIDVLSLSSQKTTSVAEPCYLDLNAKYEERIINEMKVLHSYGDTMPFLNATLVPQGLMTEYKTVKFIDQNKLTLPIWARNATIFENLQETNTVFESVEGNVFEIADDVKSTICINNEKYAVLEDNANFWEDIKDSLEKPEIITIEKNIDDIETEFSYLNLDEREKSENITAPWNLTNTSILLMKERNQEKDDLMNSCFWKKILILMQKKLKTSQFDRIDNLNDTDFFNCLNNLISEYFRVTKKDKIEIYKNFNFLFSIYRVRICREIKRLNLLHSSQKEAICDICQKEFFSPYFPYILFYLLLIYKNKIFEQFRKNE